MSVCLVGRCRVVQSVSAVWAPQLVIRLQKGMLIYCHQHACLSHQPRCEPGSCCASKSAWTPAEAEQMHHTRYVPFTSHWQHLLQCSAFCSSQSRSAIHAAANASTPLRLAPEDDACTLLSPLPTYELVACRVMWALWVLTARPSDAHCAFSKYMASAYIGQCIQRQSAAQLS